MQAPRILMVTNMYPTQERPSYGVFVKSQVDSLIKRGVDADVFFIEGYKSRLNYLKAIPRLHSLLCSNNYALIHAHHGLSGIVARSQIRCPVIVSFCGDDLYGHVDRNGKSSYTGDFFVFLSKLLASLVSNVIVKSESMKDKLPKVNVHVVPNGVDTEFFRPIDKFEAREKLHLDRNAEYILFPYSKDRVRKCYSLCEEAVARARQKTGRKLELLEVRFRPITEMPYFLNAADVVVLTSYWEGSPNVIKEAMAVNAKIVSVDVGDVKSIIEGTQGCEIAARDTNDIAEKIAKVLQLPHKTNGRAHIEALNIDRIADRILDIYEVTMGRQIVSGPAHTGYDTRRLEK